MMNNYFSLKKKIELSRILELIEVQSNSLSVIKKLDSYHKNARSHVIGITGPPGVGKSSLINNLILTLRKKNFSVGVIAVDPSSMRSGGALLGDRARFDIDPKDHKVFVRSMAAKDFLGGIAELTYPSTIVMRSIFDVLIIETVGVGQSEVSIENVVDTVVYCVQPGSGDILQFMKSGIIEIPDLIVVTKGDLKELSNITLSDLNQSKSYFNNSSEWDIKICSVSSHLNTGFDNLRKNLDVRWKWLNKGDDLLSIRKSQDIKWINKSLKNEYGFSGFTKLQNFIHYTSEPFKTLEKLKKKINITLK
ncbi:MAG: methylmalonyl Co-A mutase-associated GTPase MeaB [Rickettsiales bacterium]|nr:methylmalonyl Co-A mutase-associated GTPase MeaB [Rickettsiales bacterium]OUV53413.1 MAG: hypothetical protein CBC87_04295 [Rickettsiales bacterium TMED127]